MPQPFDTGIGRAPGLAYDDERQDLGYGRTSSKFHKPRSKSGSFPYVDPIAYEDEEDIEASPELANKMINKMATPYKSSDSLIGRSADKNAYVDGKTPYGRQNEQSSTHMVPFPDMYKKRLQVGGGVNGPMAIRPGTAPRTGTTKGWSNAPVLYGDDIGYSELEDGEDPTLVKLRKVINLILQQEEDAA
tara:strand:+ start:123 stop:689 length:567 start_codon:yes stop_codon:yes gene_type:complete